MAHDPAEFGVLEEAGGRGRRRGRFRRFGRCRCARVSAIDAGGHGDRSGSSPAGVVACASVEQMILPSLLALNADHRAIGGFHVGFSIKCYPDGKIAGLVTPKDLNAGDGLAAWPLFHGFKALFAQSRIVKAECLELCHACMGKESEPADGMGAMLQGKPDTSLTSHAHLRCRHPGYRSF
jgi:hypothetical protein